jgi:hypothetical protein
MEMEYLLKHSAKLSEYSGKCIAIVRDKLVAVSKDRLDVYEKARQKYPKE